MVIAIFNIIQLAFSFCVLVLSAVSTSVHADTTDDFIARLKSMETLQGKFTQILSDPAGLELQKTKGTFVLQRPFNFYWETSPPFEQQVIGNVNKVWVYDPDLEQVTVHDRRSIADSPAAILSGDAVMIEETYYVEFSEEDTEKAFTLTPKKGQVDTPFERIVFIFNDASLSELTLYDRLDQRTQIVLTDTTLNKKVDGVMFTFTPPEGVDLIFAQ